MPIRRHPVATGAPASKLRQLPLDSSLISSLRDTFDRLRGHGPRLGELFYARLFERMPHLKPLFRATVTEQSEKLMASLETVVQNFENPDVNMSMLAELGKRHASYGVKAEHYEPMIGLLVDSMRTLLHPDVDERHLDEWRMALRLISDQMIAAAGA